MKRITNPPKADEIKKGEIHEFREAGGGTGVRLKEGNMADVEYVCECGLHLKSFINPNEYMERKYPKFILCEIYD